MAEMVDSKDMVLPEVTAPPPPTPLEDEKNTNTNVPIDLDQPILVLSRNIKVRMMRHADAASMAKYGNNKKIAQNMRTTFPDPYTEDDAHDFITRIRKASNWTSTDIGKPDKTGSCSRSKYPSAWVITLNDDVIGSIGCEFHGDTEERSVSLGYTLSEAYWGQGIVTEVTRAYVDWLWKTYPYIVRLEAMVYAWNPASTRVLEKVGFVHEGTLRGCVWRYGKLTDLFVYGLLREGVEVTRQRPMDGDS